MRKIIILIFISILLTISFTNISFAQSKQPIPEPLNGNSQRKEKACLTNDNSNYQHRGTEQFPLFVKTPRPTTKEEAEYEQYERHTKPAYEKISVWVNGGVVFISLILLVVNIFLWITTRRAANAAKVSADALMSSERAYLFIDSIEWPNKNGSSSLGEFNQSSTIVTVVNAGRTPAILQNFNSKIIIKKNGYPSKDNPNYTMPLEIPKGVIIKSDGTETFTHHTVFSPAIISEDDFSQSTLLCYGYIRYEDIFGKIHEAGFCYELSPRQSHGRFRISVDTELNYYT